MDDNSLTLTDLFRTIERLLLADEPDGALRSCYFMVGFGRDSGHVMLRIMPTEEQARSAFAIDGHQFIAPKARLGGYFRASDGTITGQTWTPPPAPDPPIESHESLPDLGDENYIWRGYPQNTRGVIKVRIGRFLADVNAPSVAEAERLARRIADLLGRERS